MSDAPERISLELRQGLSDDFWSECRDPRYAKSEPVAYVRADRLEAQEALLREVWGALDAAAEALDWALAEISEYANIMSRDPGAVVGIAATAADEARATLAKLREHLEDKT